jgi:hypothetical protein
MKNIFKLLALSLVLVACEKHEPPTYDNTSGQTLAFFDKSSSNLEIVIDDVGSNDIQIGVTTISSSARTVSVSVDLDNSTAAADTYTVPATMTIPANEYFGTLTITGVDNNVETTAESLVLNLESVENGIVSTGTHTVSVFQICPIPDTFMIGDYLIEQTSAFVDGPTLSDGAVVSVNGSGTTRTFSTEAYPNYCGGTFFDLNFSLVCGEIVCQNTNTTCSCGNVTDWFTGATTNETYDLNDDTVFFFTFTDDTQSDCGTPAQTTYRFTKQ